MSVPVPYSEIPNASGLGVPILVVDDEDITRDTVVSMLESFGWTHILQAVDGVDAQEVLMNNDVSVVITDVLMPRLDGLGLMQWARKNNLSHTWIILSGLGTFDAALEAIHLGAFDFLPKPFQAAQLRVAVRNALEHERLLRNEQQLKEGLSVSNLQLRNNVLELERACRELEEQREATRRDLARAEVIQSSLLPSEPSLPCDIQVDAVYRPGRHVGGDLYDVWCIDTNHVAFYVADASGHGVTAAMLSVMFKQRLQPKVEGRVVAPAEVLAKVNRALMQDVVASGLFLTAAYGVLETKSGQLSFASAGHPPVVLRRANGEVVTVERTGPALGLSADAEYGEEHLQLDADDHLLVYSDGFLEELGGSSLEGAAASADALRHALAESRCAHTNDRDDVTVLLLQNHGGVSTFDNGDLQSCTTQAPNGSPSPRPASVYWGETTEQTFLSVIGRGTWMDSDMFYDTGCASLDAQRPLVIDLSNCQYLDSTFLGTMHEMVVRAKTKGAEFCLQEVSSEIRKLFDELSMRAVLDNISVEHIALPSNMRPLGNAQPEEEQLHQRMLRAHELLATLSDANHQQFEGVVEGLRH